MEWTVSDRVGGAETINSGPYLKIIVVSVGVKGEAVNKSDGKKPRVIPVM